MRKTLGFPVKKALESTGIGSLNPSQKLSYKGILKDDGYFSSISPLKRIKVAENTYDLGEYLAYLHQKGELSTDFGPVPGRMVYYPPCHLREQEIGLPYMELLKMIPGITLEAISGAFYCCGLAGVMGFKREFHETSVQLGSPLMKKIRDAEPRQDCHGLPELPVAVQPALALCGASSCGDPARILCWLPMLNSIKGVTKVWLTNQKSFSFAPGIPVEARWRKHGHGA